MLHPLHYLSNHHLCNKPDTDEAHKQLLGSFEASTGRADKSRACSFLNGADKHLETAVNHFLDASTQSVEVPAGDEALTVHETSIAAKNTAGSRTASQGKGSDGEGTSATGPTTDGMSAFSSPAGGRNEVDVRLALVEVSFLQANIGRYCQHFQVQVRFAARLRCFVVVYDFFSPFSFWQEPLKRKKRDDLLQLLHWVLSSPPRFQSSLSIELSSTTQSILQENVCPLIATSWKSRRTLWQSRSHSSSFRGSFFVF